jgi:hypothetical protein
MCLPAWDDSALQSTSDILFIGCSYGLPMGHLEDLNLLILSNLGTRK